MVKALVPRKPLTQTLHALNTSLNSCWLIGLIDLYIFKKNFLALNAYRKYVHLNALKGRKIFKYNLNPIFDIYKNLALKGLFGSFTEVDTEFRTVSHR